MPQDITFIIVTYNSEKVIEACLSTLPAGYRIIVVDNGSHDGTIALASRHASVEVIKNNNIGYGRAANAGLAKVATPYAVLLNPDVRVGEASIRAMADCAGKHADIGMVGARMFHYEQGEKKYQHEYVFDADGLSESDWIVGALLLFKMEALQKVGMFDENFFLFFEETDLCDRFVKSGYRLTVCRNAEAEHEWGTSSTPSLRITRIKAWHSAWSRAYFYRKHHGLKKSLVKSLVKAMKNLLNIVKNLLCCRKAAAVANLYEIIGIMAFFLSINAYKKDGTGRIA